MESPPQTHVAHRPQRSLAGVYGKRLWVDCLRPGLGAPLTPAGASPPRGPRALATPACSRLQHQPCYPFPLDPRHHPSCGGPGTHSWGDLPSSTPQGAQGSASCRGRSGLPCNGGARVGLWAGVLTGSLEGFREAAKMLSAELVSAWGREAGPGKWRGEQAGPL